MEVILKRKVKEITSVNQQKKFFVFIYIVSYLAFSFASTQFTPFLSNLGYDAFERGQLLASYAITTLFFQLLLGYLSDKYKTMKKILALVLIVYALASLVFFNWSEQAYLLHMAFISVSGGLLNSACGLMDTWILQSHAGVRKSISFIKAFGSIGWALGSVIVSFVVLYFDYHGLGIAITLLIGVAIALGIFIDDILSDNDSKLGTKKNNGISLAATLDLLKDKQYTLLVTILFLQYSVIVCNNITIIDKMLELGASTLEIGYKWSIQSVFEIPIYLIGGFLLRKLSAFNLLMICSIALSVQFFLYASASSVQQIIFISAMQMLTAPLLMVSSKILIFDISSDSMKSTAQMLALSIFVGLSSLIIPIFSGFLVKQQGINTAISIIAIIPLIALALIIYLRGYSRYVKEQD